MGGSVGCVGRSATADPRGSRVVASYALTLSIVLGACNAFDVKLVSPDSKAGLDAGDLDPMAELDAAGDATAGQSGASAGQGGGGRSGDGSSGHGGGSGALDASSEDDAGDDPPNDGSVDLNDAALDAAPGASPDAGSTCTTESIASYCAELPELPEAPAIDGELECGLTLRALDPRGWNGAAAMPSDHGARLAAAWRSDGLYLYVEVDDPTLEPHAAGQAVYCGDAVEIYLDADGVSAADGAYSDPGTMQFVIAAPSESSPSTIDAFRYANGSERSWPSPRVATKVRANGYALEAFLGAADMSLPSWTLAAQLGFDVGIGISGSGTARCGHQVGQYFLRVDEAGGSCSGEPWCDSQAFCTPALLSP